MVAGKYIQWSICSFIETLHYKSVNLVCNQDRSRRIVMTLIVEQALRVVLELFSHSWQQIQNWDAGFGKKINESPLRFVSVEYSFDLKPSGVDDHHGLRAYGLRELDDLPGKAQNSFLPAVAVCRSPVVKPIQHHPVVSRSLGLPVAGAGWKSGSGLSLPTAFHLLRNPASIFPGIEFIVYDA